MKVQSRESFPVIITRYIPCCRGLALRSIESPNQGTKVRSVSRLRGAKKRAQAFQTLHVNTVSSKMKDEKSLKRYREGIEYVIHQK